MKLTFSHNFNMMGFLRHNKEIWIGMAIKERMATGSACRRKHIWKIKETSSVLICLRISDCLNNDPEIFRSPQFDPGYTL